ncbi:MAG: ATP-binding protein [bacterium]|nr:ATP-binding protein [Acidimicrobiia bacterium]MCY4648822.1 ATP-binding protein [bacterium]
MLLRFRVDNYRSILKPVELSMVAIDEDRSATRDFKLLDERVLTVAGIYGSNASGKSNTLEAIAWLSHAVRSSLRGWDKNVPRDPHRFGNGPSVPSYFEIDLVVNGVRHWYSLEVDNSAILYESLHSYPQRKARMLFEREGENLKFRRGLNRASGIRDLLTPTTLILSAGTRLRDPELVDVGRAISQVGALGLRMRRGMRTPPSFHSTYRLFQEGINRHPSSFFNPSTRGAALDLLRFADSHIANVKTVAEEDDNLSRVRGRLVFIRNTNDESVTFDLYDESAGTRAWFDLLGPALGALKRGEILLFDEIDASLHPRLSARLLDLFQDPQTNRHGAQLIFTSHDTSLLSILNRDEVWLTDKDSQGATRLVALAEFQGSRVRRSLNLEKAYLQGRFGAVPDIDEVDVRRALGTTLEDLGE